jgi:hypothetical protein
MDILRKWHPHPLGCFAEEIDFKWVYRRFFARVGFYET